MYTLVSLKQRVLKKKGIDPTRLVGGFHVNEKNISELEPYVLVTKLLKSKKLWSRKKIYI